MNSPQFASTAVADPARNSRGVFLEGQNRILRLVARGEPLRPVLERIARLGEQLIEGGLCSIMLVDDALALRHGAAPSLPVDYQRTIDGVIAGSGVGSCGTAIFERRRVIVAEIESHPYWADYRETALAHGLRACWSDCILDQTGRALGSFAVYYRECRDPLPCDLDAIDGLRDLAAIAIERNLAEERQGALIRELAEQHRRAELSMMRLRESEQRFRDFTDSSSDWYWEQDENLRFTFMSGTNRQISGISGDAHYGKTRRETDPIGVTDEQWLQHETTLAQRKPFRDFRFQRVDGDGRTRQLSVNGVPVFDAATHAFKGYRGTGRDITEETRATETLRAVIEAIPAMINAKDTRSRYVFMNSYQAGLYGTTPELAVNRSAAELLGSDYGNYTQAIDARVIQTGEPTGLYEETYATADGIMRYWLTAKQPIKDGRGVVQLVISVSMDITTQKRAELQLKESQQALSAAMHRAEEASRAKSAILTNMSHELRTPLNAIVGFSEVMSREMLGPLQPARYKEYAGDILRAGRYLHDLIGDLLDTAKIESGTRKLELESIDAANEIDETVRMMAPRAQAGDVSIDVDLVSAPRSIVADRRAFRQIVLNLVGNAVKFTPNGGCVSVRLIKAAGATSFTVRDTGCGIAADQMDQLGKPFFRAENPQDSSTEGTGLGLAISKSLIELHGWAIRFQSRLGEGTLVTVEMPDCPPPGGA